MRSRVFGALPGAQNNAHQDQSEGQPYVFYIAPVAGALVNELLFLHTIHDILRRSLEVISAPWKLYIQLSTRIYEIQD